ncbi:uncharacterized protein LOC107421569 [Ziziphus jujuba]|uniref:Uncharacterized protein LOC107421569 n=1 Tax=Ziziphus jujuba TaxID=326968 RepID=A0ABM3IX42_ZIZJJ|nr:uncharacterized protein LOC107421569 [Ziziphus jujuba]XP_048337198.2 uncharacterized protein LOC107421569 [Ziziphus jujuba]
MGFREGSPTSISPLLLRNILTSIFLYADDSFLCLAKKYKSLELLRHLLITSFLFFLRLLPSLFPSRLIPHHRDEKETQSSHPLNYPQNDAAHVPPTCSGDSSISRALSQLLSIAIDIPVSSRKYEVVRSLADRIIDENNREGFGALRDVNRTVLSEAFGRTLAQLEAAVLNERAGEESGGGGGRIGGFEFGRLNRVVKAVRSFGAGKVREGANRSGGGSGGGSAEKLAAELLWLAQKLAGCGFVEEAVRKWAAASNLAWLAVSGEPRLQGSLVKLSAFMFKQAKDMKLDNEADEEEEKQEVKQIKMQMLLSWLPLLCRASNGTDAPVLSIGERAELERVLEETIEKLEEEEQQEKVLTLWLHHFTYCPSSDWPNLHASYARWCDASRKLLLHQ